MTPDTRPFLVVRMDHGVAEIHHPMLGRASEQVSFSNDLLATESVEICRTRLPAYECECGRYRLRLVYPDGSERYSDSDGTYVAVVSPCGVRAGSRYRSAISSDWGNTLFFRGAPPRFENPEVNPIFITGSPSPGSRPLDARALADDHDDHVKTLVDLAKQGREQDFRDLGAMLGVPKDRLDDLWSGTVARLKP